jgi:hypothetical protein
MEMQTQFLTSMTRVFNEMRQTQHNMPPPPPPVEHRLGEFLRTRPPVLTQVNDPLEADDWLKTMEKKLMIVRCSDREKVMFAAHQLAGPCSDWWDTYSSTYQDADAITWNDFKSSFRGHFIPAGLMELKRKEFSELKQGSMRVTEYLNRFINMARYAPEEVSTDAKKQYRFINGLTDELQLYVGSNDYANFQKLVDKVLITESKLHDVECNKRKFAS